MGVEFFPCDRCGESICDCGRYERCHYDCGRRWCSPECAALDGYRSGDSDEIHDDPDGSCNFCRGEDVTDDVLLAFLLEKFRLTHDQAVKMCIEHRS